ncbi:PucR family transcriptional regulator [Thermobifida cellulosilytica]|uniref:PucR family transcriptional regulator n=1 Tax=Thermobifida cellulosilytica TB100 TaxID=665004 RepID=A0A147KI97_THECS|nr:PucR family transcriptional regulator [Thermobifida cellulosilytica]KUP97006.1 PucR family transcriptional regulator [Thermobifida cellulosilytica TB100]
MIRLDRLVNVLGRFGVRLYCEPGARETELRSVVTHDPTDPRPVGGDVFLAVGVADTAQAVALAAAANAVVVLVRATPPLDPDTLAAARRAGIAVAAVDPAVSWSQLAAVAYGLVLEGRETEAGRGPTDLFALADTIAGAVGGPVTVEDVLSRVLAYSSLQEHADRARTRTILGRRVPEPVRAALAERGVFAHLAASDRPLFVPPLHEHGLNGRVVVAVRAGRELLGSIWVDAEAPLPPPRAAALVSGARTAALHLLRARASADLERQVESEGVLQLLEGRGDALVTAQLGLPGGPFRVVALQGHVGDDQNAAALLVFEHVTTGFGWARPGRSALLGTTVYTVLPDSGVARARDWAAGVAAALPPDAVVHAGIGGRAELDQLPQSRQEADESLALHAVRPHGRVCVSYDEAWDEILLARLRRVAAGGRMPEHHPVALLARHDREHGTRHVETLRAWFEAQGDHRAAAALLGVHPNTVRYRMRRMAEVARVDLDQPRMRLALAIALAVAGDGPLVPGQQS